MLGDNSLSSPSPDPFSCGENGTNKRKRRPAGTPDPDAEVVSLSPKTLLESDRYVCEICNQGFQRDQNLQMHRRRHKVPWKLLKRETAVVKKRVFVCPEPSCLHHDPCHALGDLVGIKKHFRRKHSNHKQWVCERCSKGYAVQSDYKAHLKTCGTRGHSCDCGRVFSRVESFIEHQDACNMGRVQVQPLQLAAAACLSGTASSPSPSSETNLSTAPWLSSSTDLDLDLDLVKVIPNKKAAVVVNTVVTELERTLFFKYPPTTIAETDHETSSKNDTNNKLMMMIHPPPNLDLQLSTTTTTLIDDAVVVAAGNYGNHYSSTQTQLLQLSIGIGSSESDKNNNNNNNNNDDESKRKYYYYYSSPKETSRSRSRSRSNSNEGTVGGGAHARAVQEQAREEWRIAMAEKAYAEEARKQAKTQMEVAEVEFRNAKRIRQEAQAELHKAYGLKQHAIKQINSTMLQITCHACNQHFQFQPPSTSNHMSSQGGQVTENNNACC